MAIFALITLFIAGVGLLKNHGIRGRAEMWMLFNGIAYCVFGVILSLVALGK